MYLKSETMKVQLSFHCQNTLSDPYDIDNEPFNYENDQYSDFDEGKDDDESDEDTDFDGDVAENAPGLKFTVTVAKAG